MHYQNTALYHRFTSILVSRLLLNLQAADQKLTGMISSIDSQVESAVFHRVIGSLGGAIEVGGGADVNDVAHERTRVEGETIVDIENSSE